MIKKNEFCLYCGVKMESKTAKKRFCSDLHRVYYNRELKRGTLTVAEPVDTPKSMIISPAESVTLNAELNRMRERLQVLKKEISNPPSGMTISKKVYINVRLSEMAEIEAKLK